MPELSPEQQLRNVAELLIKQTTPSRQHNGRGRPESYPASKAEIAQSGRHLAEMVVAYLDGELTALPDDGLPF